MAGEWVRGSFTVDGPGGQTVQNLKNFIQSGLLQAGWVIPSWNTPSTTDAYFVRSDHNSTDYWHFTGDAVGNQRCGIRVTISGNTVLIRTFLENDTQTADMNTTSGNQITLNFQSTAPNVGLLICGEGGLYVELGRDGNPTNLGHGFIGTFLADESLYPIYGARRKHHSQGFALDLTGNIAMSVNRAFTYHCGDGTGRIFTSYIMPIVARGMDADITTDITPANNQRIALTNRQILLATSPSNELGISFVDLFTLGTPYPGVDNRVSVSPLVIVQGPDENNFPRRRSRAGATYNAFTAGGWDNSGTSGTGNSTTSSTAAGWGGRDYREDRIVPRFAAVDYTIIPFANITDIITNKIYRVARVPDGGRTANIGVEWPTTVVTLNGN
jgi:hypothetical protein